VDELKPRGKWYYKKISVLIALVSFGPLAYPLLWKSPDFNFFWKIFLTVFFTALTVYLIVVSWEMYFALIRMMTGQTVR